MDRSRIAKVTVFIFLFLLFTGNLPGQGTKKFPSPSSPGKAIRNSEMAAAVAEHPPEVENLTGAQDHAEILTDTHGVDFGPYLKKFMAEVRSEWYKQIPEDAEYKKGRLAIEIAILPNGKVGDMRLVATSGDILLDRPAWDAIRRSAPFPSLPKTFTGPHLGLRLRFYYNPDKHDSPSKPDAIVHAVLAKTVQDSGLPGYPNRALDEKIEGMVRLEARITPAGTVDGVTTIEGNQLLGEAASNKIRKWTFHPARIGRKRVEDRVRINVEFYLDGERVEAQVVFPKVSEKSR